MKQNIRQLYCTGCVCEAATQISKCPDHDPELFAYLDSLQFGQTLEFLDTIEPLLDAHPRFPFEQLLYHLLCCSTEDLIQILPQIQGHPDLLIQAVIRRRLQQRPIDLSSHPLFSAASFRQLKEHWNQEFICPLPALSPLDPMQRYQRSHYPTHFLNQYVEHVGQSTLQSEKELQPLLQINKSVRKPTPPYKLAHVTSQILDGKHAPSLVIERLITRHKQFEPMLLVTDAFIQRAGEYPLLNKSALPSQEVGSARLARLNVPKVFGHKLLPDVIEQMCEALQEVDVAIFHEADPINLAIAAKCDVPLKVYYQQARPLVQPFFDLWIRCFIPTKEHLKTNTPVEVVQIPLERESVAPSPLPYSGQLLTTISAHLESRVSGPFAAAVDQILEQNKDALYLPIGPLDDEPSFISRFRNRDRVIPLGAKQNPASYAPHFSLYLNEWPQGSGFGLVDAMSGGCPVISMYDPEGPDIGKGGAVYFGEGRCVSTSKEYIELATQLLQNEEKFAEWQSYTKEQYQKITDCDLAVKALESSLIQQLAGRL